MCFTKWNNSKRQIKSLRATRRVSLWFLVGPDFHSLLIEFKNWLCLFGKGWQGVREGGQMEGGGRRLGEFSFGSRCSYWFRSRSAHCKVLTDQQKPQTCKHNKAHEEWNMILSCHNTIKWALKTFQPHSFCRNMLEKNTTMLFIRLFFFVCFVFFYCMKRNSCFNLLFWQTSVCQSEKVQTFKYNRNDSGHTATSGRPLHGGRHYP